MKLLIALLLLLVPVAGTALDRTDTGSWYDPIYDGGGVVLDISEAATLAYYFDEDGEWFFAQAGKPGSAHGDYAVLELFRREGGETVNIGVATLHRDFKNRLVFETYINPAAHVRSCDVQFSPVAEWCHRRVLSRLTQPVAE